MEVRVKRDAGRIGGRSRSQAKAEAAKENGASRSQAEAKQKPSRSQADTQAGTQGNGKERKGMEGERKEKEEEWNLGFSLDDSQGLKVDQITKTPEQKLADTLFNRRETTKWDKSELKAWKENREAIEATTQEDWQALIAFYGFKETDTHCVYRRQNLATLLNNWNGEIDKAHRFLKEGPALKQGATKPANPHHKPASTREDHHTPDHGGWKELET